MTNAQKRDNIFARTYHNRGFRRPNGHHVRSNRSLERSNRHPYPRCQCNTCSTPTRSLAARASWIMCDEIIFMDEASYAFLLGTGVIWVLYSLKIQSYPVVISQSIGNVAGALIVIGWFLYGRHK